MGKPPPEDVEPSFTASHIIGAFNIISKSRRYIEATPLNLSLQDIQAYFDVFGCDLDQGLFVECVFALDDAFLERVRKKTR